MKTVFFGTGEIGLPSLRRLLDAPGVAVVGVVTQPDRASGRGLRMAFSPVKQLALDRGVPVLQPARLRDPAALAEIAALGADLFVVMAYGQIFPQVLLDATALGAMNLHASLLPRHRGAAPVQSALLAGDARSGVTAMWMDAGLDTGDVLLQRGFDIGPDETAGSLHDRLAALAPEVLAEALALIREGRATRIPQDAALATYAPKLNRGSGKVDWTGSASEIARRVRAFHPWPGSSAVFALAGGRTLEAKLHRVAAEEGTAPAGAVLEGFLVGCGGGGLLRVLELQAAGGKKLGAADFLRGHPVVRVVTP